MTLEPPCSVHFFVVTPGTLMSDVVPEWLNEPGRDARNREGYNISTHNKVMDMHSWVFVSSPSSSRSSRGKSCQFSVAHVVTSTSFP